MPKEEPQPIQPPAPPVPAVGPIDQREADILAKLYPPFAAKVAAVLLKARQENMHVFIFEGMRDMKRQEELYAKGRDANGNVVNKKLVVTNAKPGSSYHNYGLAVDLVFDGIPSTPKVDWSWDGSMPWARLGQIGQECGLEWAGSWKSFPEAPHHQILAPGVKWRDLKAWFDVGGLANVWKEVGSRA